MSGSDHPVVVVGAGLAGLACASTIHAAGRPVRVLEASDGVGGRVRTDIVDGFRLDRGFQVMLTAYPELYRQLDPERLELCRFDPGALVQDGDRASVLSDPFRAPGRLIGTVRSPAATIADKARIVGLRHRLRTPHPSRLLAGDDIPTVDALRDAGFSDRVIDRFFRPLVGGIQLDPSLESSRRMFDIIFRMLADGDAAVPHDGMQAIPDQLARNLPDGTIELGAPVVSVAPGVVRTEHGEVRASTVVVATEGPAAARLLDLPDVASRSAGAVWFAADAAPTDERLVVLDGRGGPVLNAAVMSNVAPSYAPAGRHLIVAALPGITDGDLESTARATMRSWWGGEVDSWQVVGVNRIAHGQPVQNPPFAPKQRTRIDDGLYVCGDHRDTASIQGALFSGRRCGEAVLAATTDTVSP